ncbi:YciI family protein [Halomonas sp. MS1]|nr:YciI family protein [Halomonas sp. MS1]UTD53941.1 YciI family protein [Halomonas sp. MS1]
MFVVSLTYKVELSEVDKHINDHIAYLEKHYEKGNFIASGRKVPRTGGVILAHAESREKLNAILQEDPFFKADVASYEVTEFVPSKVGEGFESLVNLI